MTRKGVSGGGVDELRDILVFADTAPTNFSLVNAHSKDRFKATGDASAEIVLPARTADKEYRWLTCEIVWQGTLGADVARIFYTSDTNPRYAVEVVRDTGNLYKIRIIDIDSGGSETTLATGTITKTAGATPDQVGLRIQTDGVDLKVWLDGTLDIDVASTPDITGPLVLAQSGGGLSASKPFFWYVPTIWEGDAESDRPGTELNAYDLHPNGNRIQQYSDQTSCAPGDASGDFQRWDDWILGGSADDDTTYNCDNASRGDHESSELTTKTVVNVVNAMAVTHARMRANSATKTVKTFTTLFRTSELQEENDNLDLDTYVLRSHVFPDNPQGVAWSQSAIAGLAMGGKSDSGNGGNDQWTANCVLILTVDDDSPSELSVAWLPKEHRPRIIEPAIYAHT